jgi:hypothetical protein
MAGNTIKRKNLTKDDELSVLADKIRTAHEALNLALKYGLERALAFGDLLLEAKHKVPRGEWLRWLADHCGVAERTAQAYMRVAKNRPAIEAQIRNGLRIGFADALAALEKAKPAPAERAAPRTLADLTDEEVRQARLIRDAEKKSPGLIRRTLDAQLAAGEEPTRAAIMRAVEAAVGNGVDPARSAETRKAEAAADDEAEQRKAESAADEEHEDNRYEVLVAAWHACSPEDRQRFLDHIGATLDIPEFLDRRRALAEPERGPS